MLTAETEQPRWAQPYFTIWTAQAFSLLGSQLVQFALIWWLTQTTGSATVLATASLVGLVPQVLLMPVAGPLIDRWNRRKTMIFADSLIALTTLGLAFLFAVGRVQVWQVYLALFVRSIAGGFHFPAMTASTSLMVPREQLARIQGLNQMLQGGMSIASAPLGALLLSILPMPGIMLIDVVTALVAITPLFFIPVPQPVHPDGGGGSRSAIALWWDDFQAGLNYMKGWTGLMLVLVMAMLLNLLVSPAFALLPLLVTKHFGGKALQLGWMESALGLGILIGGLALSLWGGFKRRIFTSLLGLIGMGGSILLIASSPAGAFWLAVAGMFLTGATNTLTNGPVMAIFQSVVAPEMQGRAFTLVGGLTAGMAPLGLVLAGPVADALGVRSWYFFGGLACLAMGLVCFFIPAVIHIEDGR